MISNLCILREHTYINKINWYHGNCKRHWTPWQEIWNCGRVLLPLGDMLAARGGETAVVTVECMERVWWTLSVPHVKSSPTKSEREGVWCLCAEMHDLWQRDMGNEIVQRRTSQKGWDEDVRWMCRTSQCERKKNEDLLRSMGLVRIGQVMRKNSCWQEITWETPQNMGRNNQWRHKSI